MSGVFIVPTVTGSGSVPAGSASGDLGGTYPSPDVLQINGASVPDSGSVPVGNVLQISGTDILSYGPINLAGGNNFVTGILPSTNLINATTSSTGIIKLSGDLGGTSDSPTVLNINGTSIAASPTANTVLVASNPTTSSWSLISDVNVSSVAAISATKIAYSDIVTPILSATTVQGAIDSIKALAVAPEIKKQTHIISTSALQAVGAIGIATFNIGSVLPTNARVLGAEINITQALTALGLSVAVGTVQSSTDLPGTLVTGASLLGISLIGMNGTNQYLSRSGQQITLIATLTGAFFSSLTAGTIVVNIFYTVIS